MDISELYELSLWVERELTNARIHKLYSALQGKLQHNTQENQAKQPFEEETKNLISALRNIPIFQLTNQQKQILDNLDISPYISDVGAEFIEGTLYKHHLDAATAAKKVQDAAQSVNNGIAKLNSAKWSTPILESRI